MQKTEVESAKNPNKISNDLGILHVSDNITFYADLVRDLGIKNLGVLNTHKDLTAEPKKNAASKSEMCNKSIQPINKLESDYISSELLRNTGYSLSFQNAMSNFIKTKPNNVFMPAYRLSKGIKDIVRIMDEYLGTNITHSKIIELVYILAPTSIALIGSLYYKTPVPIYSAIDSIAKINFKYESGLVGAIGNSLDNKATDNSYLYKSIDIVLSLGIPFAFGGVQSFYIATQTVGLQFAAKAVNSVYYYDSIMSKCLILVMNNILAFTVLAIDYRSNLQIFAKSIVLGLDIIKIIHEVKDTVSAIYNILDLDYSKMLDCNDGLVAELKHDL